MTKNSPNLEPGDPGSVTQVDAATLAVSGDLVFATALKLRRQGEQLIPAMEDRIVVDLAAVTRVGSVGLSVLLCWLRQAGQLNKSLNFINPPTALTDICRVSGLDNLFAEAL